MKQEYVATAVLVVINVKKGESGSQDSKRHLISRMSSGEVQLTTQMTAVFRLTK